MSEIVAQLPIIDTNGDCWTLQPSNDGNIVVCNGVVTPSRRVVALHYIDHTVYQTNEDGGWWRWQEGWMETDDPTGGRPDPNPPGGDTIAVHLDQKTGIEVNRWLYGVGSSGDLGGTKFSVSGDPGWQAAAKQLYLGRTSLYRPNFGNSGLVPRIFGNGLDNPDWSHLNPLLNHLREWFGGTLLVTIGGHSASSPWDLNDGWGQDQFADACVQIQRRFHESGCTCELWEIYNEPDGELSIDALCDLTIKARDKMRDYARSVGIGFAFGGPTDTWMQSNRARTFAERCDPDFCSYHQYVTGPGDGPIQPGGLHTTGEVIQRAMRYGDTAREASDAAGGREVFVGEWNIVYTPASAPGVYDIDARQCSNIGAVFFALATTSLVGTRATMAALWELYLDTYYGVVRGDYSLSAQGAFMGRMNRYGGGQQVRVDTGDLNVWSLGTVHDDGSFCIVLINWTEDTDYNVAVAGLPGVPVAYEISEAHQQGHEYVPAGIVGLPRMSVVIVTP